MHNIGEGTKRNRNTVAICNSDPTVMELGVRWIGQLSQRKMDFALQFHADQHIEMLLGFWSNRLKIPADSIRLQRKSNSNGLTGRTWRSRFGVLTVTSYDTYLRARLQAWMDMVRNEWIDLGRSSETTLRIAG